MRKNSKILALILSIFFCLPFAACSKKNNKNEGNGQLVLFTRANPTEVSTIGRMMEAFKEKKQKEGVSFDYKVRTLNETTYNEDITKAVAAGTMGDIVYVADEYLENMAMKGIFENLDPYFADARFDFTKYDSAAFDISKCSGRNGENHLYMVPRTYDQICIAINYDLWKELLGDEYPIPSADETWTWTKMVELMADIKEAVSSDTEIPEQQKSSYYPIDLQLGWQPFYNSFIRSFGGYVYNSQNHTVGISSDETKNALAKLKEMLDNEYFNVISTSSFNNKKSPMWLISRPYVTSGLETDRGISNMRFLPMPLFDDAFTGMTNGTSYYSYGSVGFAMYSNSNNKHLAFEYLEFTLSEQGQTIWSQSGLAIPTLISMQEDSNAEWTKHPSFIEGIDQSAFTFNDYKKDNFVRIPATYARTGDSKKTYESAFYTEAASVFSTVSWWKVSADYFADRAQSQLAAKIS